MAFRRSCLSPLHFSAQKSLPFGLVAVLAVFAGAQEPTQPSPLQSSSSAQTITLPAGTHVPMVITHPIESRHIRRGDDIYAQVTSPVASGNQMVVPPGTFVQGTVDKLEQRNGRAFLHLRSMAITFPDGYVTPVPGPITLDSNEGYAVKDPSERRSVSAFLMPAAGAGIGAVIGHSVGTSQQVMTTTLPTGCTGPPPSCLSSSLTVPGSKGRDTIIGAGVGAAAGMIASMGVIFSTRHFYMDAGSPVEMTLDHPLIFQQDEVAKAVKNSSERVLTTQPVLPRPVPPPVISSGNGTCYTPGSPGTPPTVIPGAPGPDGIPGPPTTIPGTPPSPGTPYPCP